MDGCDHFPFSVGSKDLMIRSSESVLIQQLCLARNRVSRAITNVSKELSQLPQPIPDSKVVDLCTMYTVLPCITTSVSKLLDTLPGGFLFYYWLLTCSPDWIFSHLAAASRFIIHCGEVSVQEQKLVSEALLGQWSADTALVRKFVTWIGQECHRRS